MTDLSPSALPVRATARPRTANLVTGAILAFLGVCALLLALPLHAPVGPMYWDTFVYYDAINRVLAGQIPSVDFEAPVGALNYWLVTLAHLAFPQGQPLLLIHFSYLVLTAPLMIVIARQAALTAPRAAWALTLPFLFFAALPFDTVDFYPFPGSDGFGYYNRHGAHLMYLGAAAVFFVPKRRVQAALIAVILTALFFSKITAFLGFGLVLAFGLFAGLIAPFTALTVAAAFFAALGVAELATGVTSAYVANILFLAGANEGEILPRFLTALSQRFDVAAAGGALIAVLLVSQWRGRWPAPAHVNARVLSAKLQGFLDTDWMAIGVCLAAGLFFETQNTGSQAYLLVWPPVLRMLLRMGKADVAWHSAILVLVALLTLPTMTKTAHRAMRTAIASITYHRLDATHLGTLGHVSAKDLFLRRADMLEAAYAVHPEMAEAMVESGEPLSAIMSSEPDFQLLWLKTADEAIAAMRKLETDRGKRFETVFTIDFTNPFPFLMEARGPRGVAIGADPFRTVPDMQEALRAEIAATDIVLLPTCPAMTSRKLLLEGFATALEGHDRVTLTPCYDAFLRKGW